MQIKQFSGGLIAGLFFLILGLIFIALILQGSFKSAESENWPSIEGTILSSEISTRNELNSDTHTRDYYYMSKVSYNYTLDGAVYTSTMISVINNNKEYVIESEAQAIIDNYPIGKKVKVYYNPDNPSEAFLEPGMKDSGSVICGTVGSVIFVIFGALIVVGVIKKQKLKHRV